MTHGESGHRHDEHGHVHPPVADSGDDGPLGYYQRLEMAVRELLIEKGVFSADDVRREIEAMDARTPARGAAVVARAWLDSAFKARLLANGSAACQELGIDLGPTNLLVVENTPEIHNVIVCTLCSCYPRMLLGLPPDWYKSRAYRSRVVREPRAVLAEFGLDLPENVGVRVHDSTADMRYLVLPMRPEGSEGMDHAALAALIGRDSMVGVALPEQPR
jgi:nitrile hydratase